MSFPVLFILTCVGVCLLVFLFFQFREWRISRHNRKVALDYVKKFQHARLGVRQASPEEVAQWRKQSRQKR